ncbi:MAG: hypothetical protein JXK95_10850 [Bacteroidales bacterium]|nr:hypothetical protein [Bacteroidales bacterium]
MKQVKINAISVIQITLGPISSEGLPVVQAGATLWLNNGIYTTSPGGAALW